MRARAVVLAAALAALAGAASAPVLAPPDALCAPQDAPPADPLAEAVKLRDEAKALFKTAGDTALETPERSKARKECFKKLKAARAMLDLYVDERGGDADRAEPIYKDVNSMSYWVKKEMTLDEANEVMGHGAVPHVPKREPKPEPSQPPAGTGPGPAEPAQPPAKPPEPEPPKGPTAAESLAEVESYAKKHPGDAPGLVERYEAFLSKFPDPTTAEYARAAEARRSAEEQMKEVYRLARDDDPESIRSDDPAETQKKLKQLVDDLKSSDPPIRARAAKFLGFLGEQDAVPPLLELLRNERSEQAKDAGIQALADLGGRRTYEKLLKVSAKEPALTPVVLEVLSRGLKKGGPAGRLAGEELAGLGAVVSEERQFAIMETLKEGGPAAAVGLARAACTIAPDEQKAALLEESGKHKDARSVQYLAQFLFTNPAGNKRDQAAAAREAIEAIGKPSVRYLIPALDDAPVQLWAAELLRKITGTKQKDDKRKTWEAWFRKNRKTLE